MHDPLELILEGVAPFTPDEVRRVIEKNNLRMSGRKASLNVRLESVHGKTAPALSH
jgi:hypothetical protein